MQRFQTLADLGRQVQEDIRRQLGLIGPAPLEQAGKINTLNLFLDNEAFIPIDYPFDQSNQVWMA
jgi:hypothetical protein